MSIYDYCKHSCKCVVIAFVVCLFLFLSTEHLTSYYGRLEPYLSLCQSSKALIWIIVYMRLTNFKHCSNIRCIFPHNTTIRTFENFPTVTITAEGIRMLIQFLFGLGTVHSTCLYWHGMHMPLNSFIGRMSTAISVYRATTKVSNGKCISLNK